MPLSNATLFGDAQKKLALFFCGMCLWFMSPRHARLLIEKDDSSELSSYLPTYVNDKDDDVHGSFRDFGAGLIILEVFNSISQCIYGMP